MFMFIYITLVLLPTLNLVKTHIKASSFRDKYNSNFYGTSYRTVLFYCSFNNCSAFKARLGVSRIVDKMRDEIRPALFCFVLFSDLIKPSRRDAYGTSQIFLFLNDQRLPPIV